MIYKHYTLNPISIERDIEESNVPCGECRQCCIDLSPYLTPAEFESGKYIWTLIAGPDNTPCIAIPKLESGCVYFINNNCSIYDIRPLACRQFDCRKGHHPKFDAIAKRNFGENT